MATTFDIRPWLATALALCGCGPEALPVAAPAVAMDIQPSDELDDEVARLGADDAQAERCFVRAEQLPPACPDCVVRCRTRDLDACTDVARGLMETQPTCAEKVRTLACVAGSPRACTELAEQLLGGPEPPLSRVFTLLEKACDADHATACRRRGMLEVKRTGSHNDQNALRLFGRACELGDGAACFEAGKASAWSDTVEKQLERGCDLGEERACVLLATMALGGVGRLSSQPAVAEQMLSQICDGGGDQAADACFRLGQQLATRAPVRARGFLAKACSHNHLNACSSLASDHYTAGRYAEAIQAASRAIPQQPKSWLLRYTRGLSLLDTGKHQQAIPDLETLCELRTDWEHCHLWLFAARERAGTDGNAKLAKAFQKMDQSAWPAPIFRFHLGQLSAARLLQQAKNKVGRVQLEQECEAFYYIAQQWMIDGKPKKAKTMFEKSVATNVTNFIEFTGSKAELVMLKP